MKRFLLILAGMLASAAVTPCGAQTGKYYIDDREATRAEILELSASDVEKMANSVEEGVPVVRITLKAGATRTAKPHTAGAQTGTGTETDTKPEPGTRTGTPQEKAAQLVQKIYDEQTLLKEGDAAADFTAAKYAGGEQTLTALRGKVVLLNFWATWCGPCLRELAPEALPEVVLKRFAGNNDFVFLPVAYTDSAASLDKFFADDKAGNYAYLRTLTAMDPDKEIFGLYARQGVPRSFVIGRDGRIVLGSLGAAPGELERIAAAIEKALSE